MVQTRSRTRTHQNEVVEDTPKPSHSKSAAGGKSSPHPKAKEVSRKRGLQQNDETLSTPALKKSRPNTPKPSRSKSAISGKLSPHPKAKEVSRKRGLQQNDDTLSSPALKKSRPNAKKTAGKPKAKQRTPSVSKPRTLHHEVGERDVKEPIEKPQLMRTRSSSRSQSIHPHTNGMDKIVPDYKEATDNPQHMRTRSSSRSRSIIVPDLKEVTDKPQSTRSRSRSRSVYHEVCEEEEPDVTPKKEDIPSDADQLLPNADASMITPENHNTSDEMKKAALRKSQTIEHYSTAYSYTPRRYMGHSRCSHHYNDSQDSQFKDPMIICSDRLYDDSDKFLFEQDDELDKESILPTPTSSLDTSSASSEDDKYSGTKEAKSAEKKESTSFFNNFCSLM
uniref:Uncharacterized protein n=1 Tax=Panagrolaimus sp. PS1159 TaxID=55785 RepID=A0AC35FBQ6_9BILA